MLQKLSQTHGAGSVYIPPKNSYESQFGIRHFAGIVHYDSKGIIFFISESLGGGVSWLFLLCMCGVFIFRLSWEKPWLS